MPLSHPGNTHLALSDPHLGGLHNRVGGHKTPMVTIVKAHCNQPYMLYPALTTKLGVPSDTTQ